MLKTSVRGLHYRLPQLGSVKLAERGLPGLFLPATVSQLWFDRSQQVLSRLNRALEDTALTTKDDMPLPELIEDTMKHAGHRDVNVHATLLYNSQFFFDSLRPQPDQPVKKAPYAALFETPTVEFTNQPTEPSLVKWINDSFGSVTELRTLLLNLAQAINGDGYAWLVAVPQVKMGTGATTYLELAVMNTYGAGYVDDAVRGERLDKMAMARAQVEAERRQKQAERKQQNEFDDDVVAPVPELLLEGDRRQLGTQHEAESAIGAFAGRRVLPLVALDALPRAYLGDYGVFGKHHYLKNAWECIDWDVVALRAPVRVLTAVMH